MLMIVVMLLIVMFLAVMGIVFAMRASIMFVMMMALVVTPPARRRHLVCMQMRCVRASPLLTHKLDTRNSGIFYATLATVWPGPADENFGPYPGRPATKQPRLHIARR
jgi:hypothetical protein